jgi:hypothetical protein
MMIDACCISTRYLAPSTRSPDHTPLVEARKKKKKKIRPRPIRPTFYNAVLRFMLISFCYNKLPTELKMTGCIEWLGKRIDACGVERNGSWCKTEDESG